MEDQTVLIPAKIKVIGVGGGGCNAVNRMFMDGIEGVEVYAVNTDLQHLSSLHVPNKVQIGEKVTRGLGAGYRPEVGEQAAMEDIEKIKEILKDADMVFVATGLGGGTGTGAAPVIARTAKEMGILTVSVATLPFGFEGAKKMRIALEGLERLKEGSDTYIIIHNQKLKEFSNKVLTIKDAFREVDSVLSRAVRGITGIISTNAVINADFADVRTIMENGGLALIGIGEGRGEGRIKAAVEQAVSNPLLEGGSVDGARRLLITFWVSEDIAFQDAEEAINSIVSRASSEPDIIFGAAIEEELESFMKVVVIATDFDRSEAEVEEDRETLFKIIKRDSQNVKRALPDGNINPVEPEEEIPAILRRKRKI